ncbi:MAG: hypothetical protein M3Q95_02990 [Bacteroidota bacterium]|nr:hypothetical protein [Bacteroidota bacterium]
MNRNILLLLVTLLAFSWSSCNNDTDDDMKPALTTVNFIFVNEIDMQPIAAGSVNNYNASGNQYSVTLLKYYISNITFRKSDGTIYRAPNYELVTEGEPASQVFSMTVPTADYAGFGFFMGVDSAFNFAGPLTGELDPVYGMLWDWSTGYIYFKHEGEFIDSTGVVQPIVYHYGNIAGLVKREFISQVALTGTTKTITIGFDLNKLYEAPNMVDFNGNNLQSGAPGWVQTLKENFPLAFYIKNIQ